MAAYSGTLDRAWLRRGGVVVRSSAAVEARAADMKHGAALATHKVRLLRLVSTLVQQPSLTLLLYLEIKSVISIHQHFLSTMLSQYNSWLHLFVDILIRNPGDPQIKLFTSL